MSAACQSVACQTIAGQTIAGYASGQAICWPRFWPRRLSDSPAHRVSPLAVNNVRTVSDTKRAFYQAHTRPINSLYRRVVEELMVEMHLLSVNAAFTYESIYALGVVSSFSRFMQGYEPERDRDSIFAALCSAVGGNLDQYRNDAARLENAAQRLPVGAVTAALSGHDAAAQGGTDAEAVSVLAGCARHVAETPNFKYSRLFGIGLFSLIEFGDAELLRDEEHQKETVAPIAEYLGLPAEKLQKDMELYRSNLEKMLQARETMDDILAADRKKREQRERDRQAASTPPTDPPADPSSESPAAATSSDDSPNP